MIIGHVIMLKSSETCPLLIYIYKSDPSCTTIAMLKTKYGREGTMEVF